MQLNVRMAFAERYKNGETIKVYSDNQSNGNFYIHTDNTILDIQIFDLAGKIRYRSSPHSNTAVVNTGESGWYIIRVITSTSAIVTKVLLL